jgi:hypothetical protein
MLLNEFTKAFTDPNSDLVPLCIIVIFLLILALINFDKKKRRMRDRENTIKRMNAAREQRRLINGHRH